MSKIKKCDLNFIRFENSGECKDCFFLEEFVSATTVVKKGEHDCCINCPSSWPCSNKLEQPLKLH